MIDSFLRADFMCVLITPLQHNILKIAGAQPKTLSVFHANKQPLISNIPIKTIIKYLSKETLHDHCDK